MLKYTIKPLPWKSGDLNQTAEIGKLAFEIIEDDVDFSVQFWVDGKVADSQDGFSSIATAKAWARRKYQEFLLTYLDRIM
jgi:hypothetical protein